MCRHRENSFFSATAAHATATALRLYFMAHTCSDGSTISCDLDKLKSA
jgi:hypothetical protein